MLGFFLAHPFFFSSPPPPPPKKKTEPFLVLLLVRPLDPAPPLVDAVPLSGQNRDLAGGRVRVELLPAVAARLGGAVGRAPFAAGRALGRREDRGEEGFFPFDAGSVKSWIPFLLPFLLFCALRERRPVALYCKKNERTKRKRKKFPALCATLPPVSFGREREKWRPLRLLTVAALSSPGALPWPRSLSLLERRRGRGRRRSK